MESIVPIGAFSAASSFVPHRPQHTIATSCGKNTR